MPEKAAFCPDCGECAYNSGKNTNTDNTESKSDERRRGMSGNDYTSYFHPADIEANKGISLVAYILFFVPLLVAPDSKFARFHVNQGLIVFIVSIVLSIMQNIFRFGNWWNWGNWNSFNGFFFNPFSLAIGLMQFGLLACIVYGIVNAVNGKAVELPLIGKFRLII